MRVEDEPLSCGQDHNMHLEVDMIEPINELQMPHRVQCVSSKHITWVCTALETCNKVILMIKEARL